MLVLNGKDERLPIDKKTGYSGHTVASVACTMLWQIALDYGMPPDPKAMTIDEIVFWYNGLRPTLHERTKRRT